MDVHHINNEQDVEEAFKMVAGKGYNQIQIKPGMETYTILVGRVSRGGAPPEYSVCFKCSQFNFQALDAMHKMLMAQVIKSPKRFDKLSPNCDS